MTQVWASLTGLTACCVEAVKRYRIIWGGEEDRAALYCPICQGRVVLKDGVWSKEVA